MFSSFLPRTSLPRLISLTHSLCVSLSLCLSLPRPISHSRSLYSPLVQDYLWDDLSAREHMLIHAAFKGIPAGPELTASVEFVLERVQLLARADSLARQFSGGMKRYVHVFLCVRVRA